MKHLLTAIACCLVVAGSAQTPYNPEVDGNNLIGVVDLTEFLPLWGGEFYPDVNTSEPVIFETGYLSYSHGDARGGSVSKSRERCEYK